MYVGQRLSTEEIRKLAFESGDRECKLDSEVFDTGVTDVVIILNCFVYSLFWVHPSFYHSDIQRDAETCILNDMSAHV